MKRVLLAADCGFLLDVTNLHLNSIVNGYDPIKCLQTIPQDRVVQLHLAGHGVVDGELVDSHIGGIDPKVLELTEWVMNHTSCKALIIERDNQLETFDDLFEDLGLYRELYRKYRVL